MKPCKRCGSTDFYQPTQRNRSCKYCTKQTQARYKLENAILIKEKNHKYHLRKEYGLSIEDKEALFNAQDRKCASCGTSSAGTPQNPWHVDHVHDETKRVRGILCRDCNTALGLLKEDINRIEALKRYLLDTATNGDSQLPQGRSLNARTEC